MNPFHPQERNRINFQNYNQQIKDKWLTKNDLKNKSLLELKRWLNDPFLNLLGQGEYYSDTPQLFPLVSEFLDPGAVRVELFKKEFGKEMLEEMKNLVEKDKRNFEGIVKKKKKFKISINRKI